MTWCQVREAHKYKFHFESMMEKTGRATISKLIKGASFKLHRLSFSASCITYQTRFALTIESNFQQKIMRVSIKD
jgi:hypothetical protein